MIEKIFKVTDQALVVIASLAIFTMLSITTVSVIGRYLFNAPIPDDLVMNELLMVFLVFLPFAYVQRMDQHVYVSLLSDRLSERRQLMCKVFGNLVGVIIFSIISYGTFQDFSGAFEIGAYNDGPLDLPEWPSRGIVFLGVFVMTLRLLFDLVNGTRSLFTPNKPQQEG